MHPYENGNIGKCTEFEILLGNFIQHPDDKIRKQIVTLTRLGWGKGGQIDASVVFPKMYLPEREREVLFFGTFNIIISHIFPTMFTEIP